MRSIVLTAATAAVLGVGVVALVAWSSHPERPLLDAMLGFVSGAPGGATASGAGAAPAAGQAPCVTRGASLPLDDGAVLEAFVVLGPRFPSPTPGAGHVRLLVADWDFRAGGQSLAIRHQQALLPTESREASVAFAEFDLNAAPRAAAALLGADATAFSGKRASPLYTARVAPRSGLVWGEVSLDTDLDITVTQDP